MREQYEVLWPRGPRKQQRRQLAPRLQALDGKRIALLWDYLFQGDKVYEILMDGLRARFPGVEFIHWTEFGNIHGSEERQVLAALPEKLKAHRAHAVLSSMAA